MCGIAGYVGRREIKPEVLERTLALMKNRGPDHQAHQRVARGALNVDLLHSRLSIIDLDPRSNQPFTVGPATLIFNGEIYNYLEIRDKLQRRGVSFVTNSDTEVLLQAYLTWGSACVDYLEGMWSFAIWDTARNHLFLSRDRFAEKPLYYVTAPNGFYFGSEVKFIQSLLGAPLTVHYQHLRRFLVNGYKSLYKTEETFFEGVMEVPYATNLTVSDARIVRRHRYWMPRFQPQKMTVHEAAELVREKLLNSMKLRLRSDVPLAFCLSGGVDSSALASIAAKAFGYDVATFSIIDADERYDERDNISATVADLGRTHTEIELSGIKMIDELKRLVAYHDAPVATITAFVHSLLMRAVSDKGYRVAVSGIGADELFSGYYDHWIWQMVELRDHPSFTQRVLEWRQFIQPLVRNPLLRNPERYMADPSLRDHIYYQQNVFTSFLRNEFNEVFREEHFTDSLLRNRMINEMFHEGVRLILHEDDLNAMFYSVENRSPFLDRHLFEAAYRIPTEHLMRDGFTKHPLRLALAGIVPDSVRLDRHKRGFNASFRSLIAADDAEALDYILSPSPVFDIVDRQKIVDVAQQKELPNSVSKFLFSFLSARLFLEAVAEGVPVVPGRLSQRAIA